MGSRSMTDQNTIISTAAASGAPRVFGGGRLFKILLLVTILTACGKKEEKTPIQSIESLKQQAKTYVSSIETKGPYALTTPGDSLTFVGLYASIANTAIDLYKHFYDNTWNRNTYPVYPEQSRSGISLEGMLAAINFLKSKNDVAGLKQIYDYGQNNDWVYGEGPTEYTKLPQLKYLLAPLFELSLTELELPSFKGYRGNVIALWIATKGRLYGYIRAPEMKLLKELRKAENSNPIYHALIAKYESGDQGTAINILSNKTDFPADRLPEQSLELFVWNDAPAAILYLWTVFLIDD